MSDSNRQKIQLISFFIIVTGLVEAIWGLQVENNTNFLTFFVQYTRKYTIFAGLCYLKTKRMVTSEQYIPLLRKFVVEHGGEYGITRIGIFGSVARGEQTIDSDVDVLVEAPVLSLLSLISIKYRLEEMFGVSVDVVRKTEYMPLRFKTKIEKEVIYV